MAHFLPFLVQERTPHFHVVAGVPGGPLQVEGVLGTLCADGCGWGSVPANPGSLRVSPRSPSTSLDQAVGGLSLQD